MKAKKFFLRWEWLLVLLIAGVYAFFSWKLPGSYTPIKLLDQTRVYMVDVGFMALGAMLILILGDIDISVASTAALSVTVMGTVYNAGEGLPFGIALALALLVGVVCGAINGLLVTRFKELFPMIITLSTQTIYRGIAYIILKDQSAGGFPQWFSKDLGYGKLFGGTVPVMLLCVLAMFPIFYIWLHARPPAGAFSPPAPISPPHAIPACVTDRIKIFLFSLNGLLAALGGIFLTARTGSVKYTIGAGYEMQAIAIAVLGGASTAGGKAALSACCFRSS